MSVVVEYFDGNHVGLGRFMGDLVRAVDDATHAKDKPAADYLRGLVLDHLEGRLAGMPVGRFNRYHRNRSAWKTSPPWSIYRTANAPCLCYATQAFDDGSVLLNAVGVCYTLPQGGLNAWWTQTIEPRVKSLQ